uniref:U-box domain-containing protein n=1 Tax=Romanomermis culicivorax TaxID=13658 RepID=A0A915HYJ7_ROMCU
MFINICQTSYVKKIVSDKIASEDNPPENLLEDCPKKIGRSSGFMAERFVKNPVTITLEFREKIRIEKMDIGLRLGAQQTTALQLFAGEAENFLYKTGVFYIGIFDKLEKVRFERKMRDSSTVNDEIGVKILNFFHSESIDSCKFLSIKINRANHVACIGWLKIFVDCELPNLQNFDATTDSLILPTVRFMSPTNEINNDDIPEDFVDPITCHCMSLPVTLPCGHTIDKSTLDKYINVEATMGRKANDPFTGVAFEGESRPLPNRALKERIDRYFLNNPDLARKENFGYTICDGKTFELNYNF